MSKINANGYSNLSNAKRAAKAAGYTQAGSYTVEKKDGKFFVVLTHKIDAPVASKPKAAKAPKANKVASAPAVADTPAAPVEAETTKPTGFSVHGLTNCPHCNVHLSNGVLEHGVDEDGKGKLIKNETHQFYCMGCGEEFGPELKLKKRKARANVEQSRSDGGYKIQKVRPKANGIVMRSVGTKCKAIWDLVEKVAAKKGGVSGVKVSDVKAANAQLANPFSEITLTITFYNWRRFHGQRGRVNLKKAAK